MNCSTLTQTNTFTLRLRALPAISHYYKPRADAETRPLEILIFQTFFVRDQHYEHYERALTHVLTSSSASWWRWGPTAWSAQSPFLQWDEPLWHTALTLVFVYKIRRKTNTWTDYLRRRLRGDHCGGTRDGNAHRARSNNWKTIASDRARCFRSLDVGGRDNYWVRFHWLSVQQSVGGPNSWLYF